MKSQQVALVTASSQGIGAGIAQRLVDDGYKVVTFSRSAKSAAIGTLHVSGSVTDHKAVKRAIDTCISKHGRLDVLVNNSGHANSSSLDSLSDNDWLEGFELLILSVVRTSKIATPYLAKTAGRVVNISAFAARQADPDFPISSTLRSSLTNFAKLYSTQHASSGIRINNVLPGFVDSYPFKESRLKRIPLDRYAKVQEIAALVSFLCSSDSSYITGQDFIVDGGLTARSF